MSKADVASAKQHVSAAIRELIKATEYGSRSDPLLTVLRELSEIYYEREW
jgi:hypothetical protein